MILQLKISKQQTNNWKGIAIIMVVMHHFFHTPILLIPDYYFLGWGIIACSMFFFISGYGLGVSKKYMSGGTYWYKRIITIIIPLFISNTFLVVYCLLFRQYSFTISTLLDILGISNLNHPIWFMHALLLMYFALWLSTIIKFNKYLLIIIVSIIYILLSNNFGGLSIIGFPLGLLASNYKHKSIDLKIPYYVFILLILLALFGYSYYNGVLTNLICLSCFIIIILLSCTIILTKNKFKYTSNYIFEYIGKNSIYIFLVHAMAIYIATDILGYKTWFLLPMFALINLILVIVVKKITEFIQFRIA